MGEVNAKDLLNKVKQQPVKPQSGEVNAVDLLNKVKSTTYTQIGVDKDGLPIVTVKEPIRLNQKDYKIAQGNFQQVDSLFNNLKTTLKPEEDKFTPNVYNSVYFPSLGISVPKITKPSTSLTVQVNEPYDKDRALFNLSAKEEGLTKNETELVNSEENYRYVRNNPVLVDKRTRLADNFTKTLNTLKEGSYEDVENLLLEKKKNLELREQEQLNSLQFEYPEEQKATLQSVKLGKPLIEGQYWKQRSNIETDFKLSKYELDNLFKDSDLVAEKSAFMYNDPEAAIKQNTEQLKKNLIFVGNRVNNIGNPEKRNTFIAFENTPEIDDYTKDYYALDGVNAEIKSSVNTIKKLTNSIFEDLQELNDLKQQLKQDPTNTSLVEQIRNIVDTKINPVNNEIKKYKAYIDRLNEVTFSLENVRKDVYKQDKINADYQELIDKDPSYLSISDITERNKKDYLMFSSGVNQFLNSLYKFSVYGGKLLDELEFSIGAQSSTQKNLRDLNFEKGDFELLKTPIQTRGKGLEVVTDEDGKIRINLDWNSLTPMLIKTTLDMVAMRKIGSVIPSETLVGKIGSLYLGSTVVFGGSILEEELKKGLSLKDALAVTSFRLGAEAVTELANPLEFVDFGKATGILSKLSKKQYLDYVGGNWKTILPKVKSMGIDLFKFLTYTAKQAGFESLEEVLADLANYGIDLYTLQNIKPDYEVDKPTLNSLATTALTTAITMAPVAITGAIGEVKADKSMSNLRYSAAQNPDFYIQNLEDSFKRGLIDENYYTQAKEEIETIKSIYDPNKIKIEVLDNDFEKAEYLNLAIEQRELTKQLSLNPEKAEKLLPKLEEITNELNKYNKKANEILGLSPDEKIKFINNKQFDNLKNFATEENIKGANIDDLQMAKNVLQGVIDNNPNEKFRKEAQLQIERINNRIIELERPEETIEVPQKSVFEQTKENIASFSKQELSDIDDFTEFKAKFPEITNEEEQLELYQLVSERLNELESVENTITPFIDKTGKEFSLSKKDQIVINNEVYTPVSYNPETNRLIAQYLDGTQTISLNPEDVEISTSKEDIDKILKKPTKETPTEEFETEDAVAEAFKTEEEQTQEIEKKNKEYQKDAIRLSPFGTVVSDQVNKNTPQYITSQNVLKKLRDLVVFQSPLNDYLVSIVLFESIPNPEFNIPEETLTWYNTKASELDKKNFRFAVLSDKQGNFLTFDIDGNPSETGRLALQTVVLDAERIKKAAKQRTDYNEEVFNNQAKRVSKLRDTTEKQIFEISNVSFGIKEEKQEAKTLSVVDFFDGNLDKFDISQGASSYIVTNKETGNVFNIPNVQVGDIPDLANSLYELWNPTSFEGLPEQFVPKEGELNEADAFKNRNEYIQNLIYSNGKPKTPNRRLYKGVRVLVSDQPGKEYKITDQERVKKYFETATLNVKTKNGVVENKPFTLYIWDGSKFVAKEVNYKQFTSENYKISLPEQTPVSNRYITFGKQVNSITPQQVIVKEQVQKQIIEEKEKTPIQKEETPKQTKFKKKDGFGDTYSPDLFRAIELLQPTTKEQEAKAEEWFKDNIKVSGASFKDLRNIYNSKAVAQWINGAIILYKGGKFSDTYHEAFHNFTQLFLTPQQKEALYNEALNTETGKQKLKEFANSKKLKVEDLSKMQKFWVMEEMLAEDFRNYMLSDKKLILNGRPKRNSIFRRVYDFLKELFTGNPSIEQIYERLSKNEFKNFKPDIKNAFFGTLNKAIEGYNYKDTQSIHRVIDSLMASSLRNNGFTISRLFTDINFLQTAYNEVYNNLVDTYSKIEEQLQTDLTEEERNILEDQKEKLSNLLQEVVWDNVVKNHFKYSKFLKISKAVLDDIEEVPTKENWDEQEKAAYENAANQILYLVATLPQFDSKGKPVMNDFISSIQDIVDFSIAWNQIAKATENSISYEEMYQKLQKLAQENKSYQAVLQSLPSPNSELTFYSNQIKNLFVNSLGLHNIPTKTVKFEKRDGKLNISMQQPVSRSVYQIKSDWDNNFQEKPNSFSKLNDIGRRELNLPKLLKEFDQIKSFSKSSKIKFLNALGFTISPKTENSQEFQEFLSTDLPKIFTALQQYQNLQQNKTILLSQTDIDRLKSPIYSTTELLSKSIRAKDKLSSLVYNAPKDILDNLIEMEAKYSDVYYSDNSIAADGTDRWQLKQFSQQSTVYLIVNNFEKYPTYQDLIRDYPFLDISQNPDMDNLFINSVFDLPNGNRRKDRFGNFVTLELYDHNGLRVREDDTEVDGITTNQLTPFDKLTQDISTFLLSGYKQHPVYGDKNTTRGTFTIYPSFTGTSKSVPNVPVELSSFQGNVTLPLQAWEIVKKSLQVAMRRTQDYYVNGVGKNWENFNKNIDHLGYWSGIINSELEQKLIEKLKSENTDINTLIEENKEQLKKDFIAFIKEDVKDLTNILNSNPLLTPQDYLTDYLVNNYSLNDILTAFSVNSWIYNSEHDRFMFSDPRFSILKKEKYAEIFKRRQKAQNSGFRFINDKQTIEFLNKIPNYEAQKLSQETGENIPDVNQYTYNTTVFADIELSPKTWVETEILPHFKTASKEEKIVLAKKLVDANTADAVGIAIFDFYTRLALRSGEESFTQDKLDLWAKISKGEELTPEEAKNSQLFFPPRKLVVSGYGFDNNTKQWIPIYYKFAVTPLIPSGLKGKHYDEIRKKFLKENIQLATFKSGSKHSMVLDANGKMANFYDLSQEYPITTLPFEFTYEVIKPQEGLKNEVSFPTQLRTILFTNYLPNGVPVDFEGKNWESLSETEKKKQSEIYANYIKVSDIIDSIYELEKSTLLKKIDAVKDKDGNYTFNEQKFSALLEEQMEKSNVSLNVLESITVNENGNFTYTADATIGRPSIEKVIMSIVDNKLRRQYSNGEALVQTSSTGYEPTDFEKSDDSTSDLEMYKIITLPDGKQVINPAEIRVSISIGNYSKLYNLPEVVELSKNEKTINKAKELQQTPQLVALNELLKDSKFVNKYKKLVSIPASVRIPTQGHNSMEFFTIKEFMPHEYGNTAIFPDKFYVKNGSDNDNDKQTALLPNIFYNPYTKEVKLFNLNDIKLTDVEFNKELKNLKKPSERKLSELNKIRKELNEQLKQFLSEKNLVQADRKNVISQIKRLDIEIALFRQQLDILEEINFIYTAPEQQDFEVELLNSFLQEGTDEVIEIRYKDATQSAIEQTKENIKRRINQAIIDQKFLLNGLNITLVDLQQEVSYTKVNLDKLDQSIAPVKEYLSSLQELIYQSSAKKAYENELIFTINNLLSNPLNFENLMQPNSTYIFDEQVKQLPSKTKKGYANNATVTENLKQHVSALEGKGGIGILAVWNKTFPLFQATGMYLNPTYLKEGGKRGVNKDGTPKDLRYTKNRFPHNTKIINGQEVISVSDLKAGDYKISEIISQMMNGYLDAMKDPWAMQLFKKEFLPTIPFVAMQGVGAETLTGFFLQPIMKDFVRNFKNYKSLTVKLKNRNLYAQAKNLALYDTLIQYDPSLKSLFGDKNASGFNTGNMYYFINNTLKDEADLYKFIFTKDYVRKLAFKEEKKIEFQEQKFKPLKKIINNYDLENYQIYLQKSGGKKPKEFFTPSTKFTEFYDNSLGVKRNAPQTSKWILNEDGLYDLIDKQSGEVYITSVDLGNGFQFTKLPIESKEYQSFLSENEKRLQVYFLIQYLEFEEQQKIASRYRRMISSDTNKSDSIYNSSQRVKDRKELSDYGLFPEELFDKILTQSPISAFSKQKGGIDDFVTKLSHNLFEITNHPVFAEFMANKWETDNSIPFEKKFDIKESWIKTMQADFIQYIYQNYVYKPNSAERVSDWYFKTAVNPSTALALELEAFKKKYPDIKNLALDFLTRDELKERGVVKQINIKLRKKIDEITASILSKEFENGLNFQHKDPKIQQETQQLFKKLAHFGFIQSGFSPSNLSFTSIIPNKIYANQMTNIIPAFAELLNTTPTFTLNFFYNRFKQQNPRFYEEQFEEGSDVKIGNFESNRGKQYRNNDAPDILGVKAQADKIATEQTLEKMKQVSSLQEITKDEAKDNPTTLYLYEDNEKNQYAKGSKKIIFGKEITPQPNAIPLYTGKTADTHYKDKDLSTFAKNLNYAIEQLQSKFKTNQFTKIVIPSTITEVSNLKDNATKLYEYLAKILQEKLNITLENVTFTENLPPTEMETIKETPVEQPTKERIQKQYPQNIEFEVVVGNIPTNKLKEAANFSFDETSYISSKNVEDYADEIKKLYGEAAFRYVFDTGSEISKFEGQWLKSLGNKLADNFITDYLESELGEGLTIKEFAQKLLDKNVKLVDTWQLDLFSTPTEKPTITKQIDEVKSKQVNIKGIEINSYQTGLGNDLTNVHYANKEYPKSKYPIIPSNKELKLTQAAKSKWGESVEAWYKSNNSKAIGIPEGETTINPDEYTNHSGGALGADSEWDIIGQQFGFKNNKHYYHGSKTPRGNSPITDSQLKEGIEQVKKTYSILGRPDIPKYYPLHGRNWFQVKNADAVFAISDILNPGEKDKKGYVQKSEKQVVAGGTGYAVEMAIQNNKPVYVFHQKTAGTLEQGWYKWNYTTNQFDKIDTPILTKNFAGIGTREINEAGKKAIKDVYQKTLQNGENQADKHDFDLMVSLITDKLTQYPDLVRQINERGGLEFLQKSTHTMGVGRWSSKNPKNMFMKSLIQAYQNVSKPQEQIDVKQDVKEGVDFVFNENPGLANSIYESLGFYQNNKEAKKAIERAWELEKESIEKVFVTLSNDERPSKGETVFIQNIETDVENRGKGLGLSTYITLGEKIIKEGARFVSSGHNLWDSTKIWQKLYNLGLATRKETTAGNIGYTYEYVGLQAQITPQQKQQAQQVYSQYLDTIFPDSKVKDIVYHGTKTKDEFEKFITEREYPIQLPQFKGKISKGSFFTKDKSIADVAGIRTITAILNMENPLYRNKGSEYLFKEDVEDIQKNNDSLIAPGNKEEFIVFEPEQIHILSSKQDIEGFKNFVSKQDVKGVEVSKPVANIPQNKVSGIESYGSLVTANDEVIKVLGKNPHSIDMIEAGFRTRTTRSESEMTKYAIKVGDIIKHFGKSADGTTKNILARVTAIHPKGTPGWKGTWKKEGWRLEDVNVIDRFKDGAAAIEFEVIKPTTTQQTEQIIPKTEITDKDIDNLPPCV